VGLSNRICSRNPKGVSMKWLPTPYIGNQIIGNRVKVWLMDGLIMAITRDYRLVKVGIADYADPRWIHTALGREL
jgi:hypothetical protein